MAEAPQDDHHGHDVHFESADAGASLTYPQQAGTLRKNGFLVIKGRPCKVRGSNSDHIVNAELLPMGPCITTVLKNVNHCLMEQLDLIADASRQWKH
jgi:hypothetical protein